METKTSQCFILGDWLGELGLTRRTEHFVAVKNDACRASDIRGNVSSRPLNVGDRMETLSVNISAMRTGDRQEANRRPLPQRVLQGVSFVPFRLISLVSPLNLEMAAQLC